MKQEKDVQPIRDRATIEDMKKALLKYCSYRDYVYFTLGINVGLRVSDILKLQVKDVRGKTHIQLREQKTKKVSRFYLPAPL